MISRLRRSLFAPYLLSSPLKKFCQAEGKGGKKKVSEGRRRHHLLLLPSSSSFFGEEVLFRPSLAYVGMTSPLPPPLSAEWPPQEKKSKKRKVSERTEAGGG